MKKAFVVVMAVLFISLGGMNAEAAEKNWNLVEVTVTVKSGDTLESIAREYMKKNTYGSREIHEFIDGIRELNEWLLKRDIRTGDTLRINYWEKRN